MANKEVNLIPGTSVMNTDIETLIRSDERLKIATAYISSCVIAYPDKGVLTAILGINTESEEK